ncbi:2OG-Fe(II) oxygenase family protein [Pseudoalteromonas sp. bablab_jr011]|jgi:Rps23 Pro-64 3,4-dihydroxylase Tpa1-like proline 4-hydroxylase|uniref:2OG-Fe(II) oxygenase family protein n=1 Tax=Pseudoalteromonas sp. bablab_jr011 TaxID=2755062 RepID=UPI001A7ED5AE|nr:2OG-Fe(II) oxygenase family protein [Pseudoalteromonas sp. bablab_jr011]
MKLTQLLSDLEKKQRTFKEKRFLVLKDVWDRDNLQRITLALNNEITYLNAFALNGKYIQASDSELKSMDNLTLNKLQRDIYKDAQNGIGFFYGRHKVEPNTSPPILLAVHRLLNAPETLRAISELTGIDNLTSASIQATRYIQGNFLTRHNDVVESEGRRVAYVFSFNENWHPDWGGLLHFYDYQGTLTNTVMPQNNVLTLFDVHNPHSVSYVSPFSGKARYSITGWFNQ